jgi:hypothetical protein
MKQLTVNFGFPGGYLGAMTAPYLFDFDEGQVYH